MNILAINGSHRKGKNTAALLNIVLEQAATMGAKTELLELTDFSIKYCVSCNKCLRKPQCSIADDDMVSLGEKLMEADGILLGSPVYFTNVTALMKNFMDRSRYLHMTKNVLAGKVGAAITNAGLRHGGQETTLRIMEYFLQTHGLHIVDTRDHNGPVIAAGAAGFLMVDYQDGKEIWRASVAEDELTVKACKLLGQNMVKLIQQLNK